MKRNKAKFTLEDFEEGLALCGHILPRSLEEFSNKEALDHYESEEINRHKKAKKETFFKRVVLAAEIANRLYNEPTFGHVKFQKIVYLLEHVAEMDLNNRYSKEAAGPFDRKFMHSIDSQLKKQKWFNVQTTIDNNIKRYRYSPLENRDNYKPYFESFFHKKKDEIFRLIEIFRNKKTDSVEITATLFACLIELGSTDNLDREKLLSLFYNWSKQKSRFAEKDVLENLDWMFEIGLIPR